MQRTPEARSFYTQISRIAFVGSAILLVNSWGAIAPLPAHSATLKQNLSTQNLQIIEGAIAPNESKEHLIFGSARQTLTINLASAQVNAVFTLVAPDGKILASNSTSWIGSLQTTGQYRVIISSTRGGAIYSMRYTLR